MNIKLRKSVVFASVLACLHVGSIGWAVDDPLISLSVEQTEMSDVLKFIAAQSGVSVVMAPDVSASQLTLDLQEVPLSECLDVILKPYGYGYRRIGKTIVVDKLEGLKLLTEVEPLQTKVFKLKYMNSADILLVVQGVLSPRGSVNVVDVTQVAGWDFADASGDTDVGKRERKTAKKSLSKSSKTIVVQDVPEIISQVTGVLTEIDVEPSQIEIRTSFIEFTDQAIRDLGVEFRNVGLKIGDRVNLGGQGALGNFTANSGQSAMGSALSDAAVSALSGEGLLAGARYLGTDFRFDVFFAAIQENVGVNVMSAPRILAQENQEATIVVGRRLPILTYENIEINGTTSIETKLDYYEQIGIQLNVVPQVCDNGLISMVIHPAVSEQDGVAQVLDTAGDPIGFPYPIIRTREAETRLLVQNGETISLGGLMTERVTGGVRKVPLLGDIPFLGRLFRRDTTKSEKVELVIFLSAYIQGTSGEKKAFLNNKITTSEDNLSTYWKDRYENPEAEAKEYSDKDLRMKPLVIDDASPIIMDETPLEESSEVVIPEAPVAAEEPMAEIIVEEVVAEPVILDEAEVEELEDALVEFEAIVDDAEEATAVAPAIPEAPIAPASTDSVEDMVNELSE